MAPPFYNPKAVLIDTAEPGCEITLEAALSGTLITGASGSGKTTTGALLYKQALLRSTAFVRGGAGFVLLYAKPGEAEEDAKIVRRLGRAADLVPITEGSGIGFNFLDWLASMGGGPLPIVSLLMDLAGIVAPQGDASNPFWETATRTLITYLVLLAQLARLRVSIACLQALLLDAPQSLAEARSPVWQRTSALWQAILEAEAWTRDDAGAEADLAAVRAYFCFAFAKLDERTRSPVVLMSEQVFAPLMLRPLRPLLCEETRIRPEDTFDGRIVQVDLPVADYQVAGKLIAGVWKRCVQLACLKRRGPVTSKRPVVLLVDEAQEFLSAEDARTAAVARSAGLIQIFITQQFSSIKQAIGPNLAENLASNLSTKWFFQNTGETNDFASQLIGGRFVKIASISTGGTSHHAADGAAGGHGSNTGVSVAEQHRPFVQPVTFLQLKRGGSAYGRTVEAVLFSSGKLFDGRDEQARRTGERVPFKILSFQQEEQ